MSIYALYFLAVVDAIEFELRGSKGHEEVHLYDQDSGKLLLATLLKKQWHKYSYPNTKSIRIHFVVDRGDVFVNNAVKYSITFVDVPKYWKCGTTNPNIRCDYFKKGAFYWEGNYIISVKGKYINYYCITLRPLCLE